jgi:ABC-type transport system involved in multi-copper enzyme maturation permease subunit
MTLPATLFVVRCLVVDTFRQSLATRTFWLILGLSGLAILLCASVRIEGATATTPTGEIELFGADCKPFTGLNEGAGHLRLGFLRLRLPRDARAMVAFLHALLALLAAGGVGMLLVVLWTSSFLPEFLEPRAASVLLAKPVPRWALLAGKYLGVLAFVAFQAAVFVGGTWLALALATGEWDVAYLLAIPLLVMEFAFLYAVSALLTVWSRSTVVSVFGTIVFWSLCGAVSYQRNLQQARAEDGAGAPPALEAAYWVLPKPADVALLTAALVHGDEHFRPAGGVRLAAALDPELSIGSSLLFTVGALTAAGWFFARRDY